MYKYIYIRSLHIFLIQRFSLRHPHLQGSTVVGPSFVPRGHLRSEAPSLFPAAFLGREETPGAVLGWSPWIAVGPMKMVINQASLNMTCISISVMLEIPRGMELLVI